MYVGEPPERMDVPARALIHVEAGTPRQSVNHGDEELVIYAYGRRRTRSARRSSIPRCSSRVF
jgi:hypothetical protein